MTSPSPTTFRPRAVRNTRKVAPRDSIAEAVQRMSADELAMLGDVSRLPVTLANRVLAARKNAADQERVCECRRTRWNRELELRDAALAAVAAADEGDVSLALNRLRAALGRVGAA